MNSWCTVDEKTELDIFHANISTYVCPNIRSLFKSYSKRK